MKRLIIVIALYMLLSPCATFLRAEEKPSIQDGTSKTTIVLKKNQTSNGRRPKAPNCQVISCSYDGTTIELHFTVAEGNANLNIHDANLNGYIFYFDTSKQDVCITSGTLSMPINVEVETDNGNLYSGIIQ